MFPRFAVTFLALSTLPYHAAQSSSSPPRDGFLAMVSKHLDATSGHLRRNLNLADEQDVDVCQLVERHLGNGFTAEASGNCNCQGNLTDTLWLECSFDNVCEDDICASIDVNVTLSDILDDNGLFGEDPKMYMEACVDTNVDFLEKMCVGLDFAKPDFFVPEHCSFSYGSLECDCKVDPSDNCYEFDCSSVVPSPLDQAIVADTCKTVDIGESINVAMFLPSLQDLPKEAY
jgi:hypothetical protein